MNICMGSTVLPRSERRRSRLPTGAGGRRAIELGARRICGRSSESPFRLLLGVLLGIGRLLRLLMRGAPFFAGAAGDSDTGCGATSAGACGPRPGEIVGAAGGGGNRRAAIQHFLRQRIGRKRGGLVAGAEQSRRRRRRRCCLKR